MHLSLVQHTNIEYKDNLKPFNYTKIKNKYTCEEFLNNYTKNVINEKINIAFSSYKNEK